MNVTRALILKLFSAASIQRWNDKMRPMYLSELDKQAHKMIIAYLIAKLEEEEQEVFWIEIIEGGIFELLQRIVLTDLRPQIYYRIKEDPNKYKELNDWVYRQLSPFIKPLGDEFCEKYKKHFQTKDNALSSQILGAAHFLATKWEFKFIERANPDGYEIAEIKRDIVKENEMYYKLEGMKEISLYSNYSSFIDLCGELRFQIRWSTVPRVPQTSVLGHMLLVAILSYLFSLEIRACESRCKDNYYTGLFHDLPEVLTRDIISPVKKSIEGLDSLIKQYEKEAMEANVYRLLKPEWRKDIRFFTENEFRNVILFNRKYVTKSVDEINAKFNADEYRPRDGELVKAADEISAFVEAYTSIQHGITDPELIHAQTTIKDKYQDRTIGGIDFGRIMADFEH